MDNDGNLPAHLVTSNEEKDYADTFQYLYSEYPEAFLQKNNDGELPIDCCPKDDERFLHLARLCPESLFHIDDTKIQDSLLLSPVLEYLSGHHNLPKRRTELLRQVFHHAFQCILTKKALSGSGKDEQGEAKLKRERDDALREKEKFEESWKSLSIDNKSLNEKLKQEKADLKRAGEKLKTVQNENAQLTDKLKDVETRNDMLVQDIIKEGQKLDAAMLPIIETPGQDDLSVLPIEALKALASFLNKRLELVKSHGDKPSQEQSREEFLVQGFLSNPNPSRSSLTDFIKHTHIELQKVDVKLPSNSCTATTANPNPQSTVVVDESPENRRVKRARVSLD